jgi:hypothetical protein
MLFLTSDFGHVSLPVPSTNSMALVISARVGALTRENHVIRQILHDSTQAPAKLPSLRRLRAVCGDRDCDRSAMRSSAPATRHSVTAGFLARAVATAGIVGRSFSVIVGIVGRSFSFRRSGVRR